MGWKVVWIRAVGQLGDVNSGVRLEVTADGQSTPCSSRVAVEQEHDGGSLSKKVPLSFGHVCAQQRDGADAELGEPHDVWFAV